MPHLPVLVFDFDGTVALGEGPVMAYGRSVAEQLAEPARGALLASLAESLCPVSPADSAARDGYDRVRTLALAVGADDRSLRAGYEHSRASLGLAAAPIRPPAGLATFLTEHAGIARRVLVTNAPSTRLPEALALLGLASGFDQVFTDAGKPDGFPALLATLGAEAPLVSIGDVWENDLAPAQAAGFHTALVGGRRPVEATPDLSGESVTDLLPALTAWVRNPTQPIASGRA